MNCCGVHTRGANRLFSWLAAGYCRRFKRKGFEPSQRQLLTGLAQQGVDNATVLEIGSGVGHLHMTLLERGAQRAVGVDLSPRMLQLARGWAQERGLAERVTYVEGDFVQRVDAFETADVTVLDKVICCYPDARALVTASLAKTERIYAFTIPRNRWSVRLGVMVGTAIMRVLRCGFHPYLHDPATVDAWVTDQGFERVYEETTWGWLTRVYARQ